MNKSHNLVAIALMFLLATAWGAADKVQLAVVEDGKEIKLDESAAEVVRYYLHTFFLSCLYRNVINQSSKDVWEAALKSPSYIRCQYSQAESLALPERRTLRFTEILVTLPKGGYPDHILLRDGDQVLQLGKYDPWVLGKLVKESKTSLTNSEPYKSLISMPRGLF